MDPMENWMRDDDNTSFDAIYAPYYTGGYGMPVKYFFRNGVIYSKFQEPDSKHNHKFNPALDNFKELDRILFAVYANKENLEKSSKLLMPNGTFVLDLAKSGWIYASPDEEGIVTSGMTPVRSRPYTKLILVTLVEYNELSRKKRELKGWPKCDKQIILPTAPRYKKLL